MKVHKRNIAWNHVTACTLISCVERDSAASPPLFLDGVEVSLDHLRKLRISAAGDLPFFHSLPVQFAIAAAAEGAVAAVSIDKWLREKEIVREADA